MSICSISCTMALISTEQPPRWPGEALHGLLFRRLGDVDREAAEFAHNREPRPFALSFHREGAHFSLRCVGLAEPISRVLEDMFEAGMELEVGPGRLRVLEVETERSGYEELYEKFVPVEKGGERLGLRFTSPTTFRVGKANMPLPLPRLLWRSWAARWNAFSEVQVGNFEEWAEEFVVPARFKLRSQVARLGKATLVGCLGDCEYRVLQAATVEARVAEMLAAYGSYCGSGQKTTMGLGVTEVRTP